MDKDKIIALLNKDLEDEHGAIIQYLSHAYAIGEGEMACEIEAIAREEMRHLDWLAETIIELGGIPSIQRGTMRTGGDSVDGWMKNNVILEEGAIAHYQEHIELIDDPRIKRLLRRILSDEKSHRGDFEHFVDKAKREGNRDLRGTAAGRIIQTLNWGIEHEYTVVLQYLLQSYMTTDEEIRKQLQDQAINEMQHLGWLAEKIVGRGASPIIEHAAVDSSTATGDMLRADIKSEQEVAVVYDRAASEAEDPELKKLFLRLRDHEIYHSEVFSDLLKEQD